MKMKLVVVDSGWVFAGVVDEDASPDYVVLPLCENVERWGTTEGLGELAENGPIEGETRLRRVHRELRIPRSKVLFTIEANPERWAALIAATHDLAAK